MANEVKPQIIHAPVDRRRALIALLFLIGAFVIIVYALISKGYSIIDYPSLILSGELGWASQLAMWVAFVVWIGRYSHPAWEAMGASALISESDGILHLASGHRVPLHEVIEIKGRNSLLNKDVEFGLSDGRTVQQHLMFSSIPARLLITRLRERAPAPNLGGV